MKKLFNLLFVMFVITSLHAQNVNLEKGKMYYLHFNNGNAVKVRITDVSEQTVTCNLNDAVPATFNLSDITKVEPVSYPQTGSIGLGIGVPYGVLGVNAELAVLKYFSLSGGLGTSILAGSAYSVGGKIYLAPPDSKWRPRLSAHYGTNAIIAITNIGRSSSDIKESFQGMSLGAGILGMFGDSHRIGFDFDVIYTASRGDFDTRLESIKNTYSNLDFSTVATGKIKISIGFRIAF